MDNGRLVSVSVCMSIVWRNIKIHSFPPIQYVIRVFPEIGNIDCQSDHWFGHVVRIKRKKGRPTLLYCLCVHVRINGHDEYIYELCTVQKVKTWKGTCACRW